MSDTVYTPEVTANVVARYVAVKDETYKTRTAVVAAIANELGVTVPSVRGKLSAEKVYIPKEAEKDSAEASTSKAELANAIGVVLGAKVPSFEKATKRDLETLWSFLRTSSDQFNAEHGIVEPTA